MNNRINSSTFPRPVDPLRAFVRRYLASHPKPDIGDVLPALAAMGNSRELIEAAFEAEKAARASAGEKAAEVLRWTGAGEAAAALPELEETTAGLERALELSGQEVRWNTRGGWIESRGNVAEEWIECDGGVLDDLMVRCSQVALLRVGSRTIPWKIRSRKDEARILGFVARKRPEAGVPSHIHAEVLEWAEGRLHGRMTYTQIKAGAGVLQKFERGARSPRWVDRAVKNAMEEAGWMYLDVRVPGKSGRKRWCAPGDPLVLKRRAAEYSRKRG